MDVNLTKAANQAEQLGRMFEGVLAVAEVAKNLRELEAEKRSLETRLEQVKEDLAKREAVLSAYEKDVENYRAQIGKLETDVAAAQSFLRSVSERENAAIVQAKEEANRVLVEADNKKKDVLKRLSVQQQELEKTIKNLVGQKAREEKSLQEAKDKLRQFKEGLG